MSRDLFSGMFYVARNPVRQIATRFGIGPAGGHVKRTTLDARNMSRSLWGMSDPICPLCERAIPPDAKQSLHHLIPKLKGGKGGPVVLLHQICHSEIHATLTEAELARDFHNIDALRTHPRLAKFIAWVAKRPADFHSRSAGGRRKKNR